MTPPQVRLSETASVSRHCTNRTIAGFDLPTATSGSETFSFIFWDQTTAVCLHRPCGTIGPTSRSVNRTAPNPKLANHRTQVLQSWLRVPQSSPASRSTSNAPADSPQETLRQCLLRQTPRAKCRYSDPGLYLYGVLIGFLEGRSSQSLTSTIDLRKFIALWPGPCDVVWDGTVLCASSAQL